MASRGFQDITLIGNIGRNPELRYTPSGIAVCNVSLAVNGYRRNPATNENEDTVEWFRLVLWDKAAENFSTYVTQGRTVFVKCRLQTRDYTDNAGIERKSYDFHVSTWLLLDSRRDEEESPYGEPPY